VAARRSHYALLTERAATEGRPYSCALGPYLINAGGGIVSITL